MHEVLVNRLGGLSLRRKSVVTLTDRPGMTLDVHRGRKTTTQQQHYFSNDVVVLQGDSLLSYEYESSVFWNWSVAVPGVAYRQLEQTTTNQHQLADPWPHTGGDIEQQIYMFGNHHQRR